MLWSILLTIAGCFEGAPRRHPLDPQGENFQDEGGIQVKVTSFYSPRQGLAKATVKTSPGSFLGETDVQGNVFIPELTAGSYTLTVEKTGYALQTQLIEVSAGESKQIEIPLPALPVFTEINISTSHISRWWPPPEELFQFEIEVLMDDQDGLADITEVWLELPDFDFRETLAIQTEPGKFVHTIREADLPVSLPALLGHPVIFYARDRASSTNQSEAFNLFRVIENAPLAVSPQGLQLLDTAAPQLNWELFSASYPFSYQVDVVRVDNNIQNLVLSLEGVSSDSTSVQAPALAAGEYFWTVSVVDAAGNRSRSREAGFRIP